LEPTGEPHGFFHAARIAVAEAARRAGLKAPSTMEIEPEALADSGAGPFDFVFSVHVLEHVNDLDSLFGAMVGMLAEGGAMVHLCPNYAFPYEPHFRVPIWHRRPSLTARFFPGRIQKRAALWSSLEFITHDRVLDLASAHDCVALFEPGLLHEAILRLDAGSSSETDSPGALSRITSGLRRTSALPLVRKIPSRWASPMCFVVRRREAQAV
jgi:SAM-dependent methyltransferase